MEEAAPAKTKQVAPMKMEPPTSAKTDQAAPAQKEHVAPVQTGLVAPAQTAPAQTGQAAAPQTEQVAPPQREQAVPAQTEQVESAKAEQRTKSNTGEATSSPMTEDPATASIDRSSVAGQPLCMNSNSLTAMLVAGLLTSNPKTAVTNGCQTLAENAKLTRLERYPSIFPFLRIVRVKVASPTQPNLTFGFTIEMGR